MLCPDPLLERATSPSRTSSSSLSISDSFACETFSSASSLIHTHQIFLPSTHFLQLDFLKDLVESDDAFFIWLVVGDCGMEQSINGPMLEISKAVGLNQNTYAWRTVQEIIGGKLAKYYVSAVCSENDVHNKLPVPSSDEFDVKQPPPPAEFLNVFCAAGLRSVVCVPLSSSVGQAQNRLYLLEKPAVCFPPLYPARSSRQPGGPTPFTTPTMAEWRKVWKVWDLVTLSMIPHEMLHQKPIHLRNCCLFYIGHLPTFLDILLSKRIQEEGTEPTSFRNIFERGIDPHVDDPNHCHNHSKVPEAPEDWPSLASIIAFRDRVRARVARVYDEVEANKRIMDRSLARTLVMCYEHEGWHIETLLYMLVQRAGTGTLPPPGTQQPPWELLAKQWDSSEVRNHSSGGETVIIGPAQVTLGHDDSEADDDALATNGVSVHNFGWDNESPKRSVAIGKIKVSWRCVTNKEYMEFWLRGGKVDLPSSWVLEDGVIQVRTLFGPVAFEVARHWPVLACYDHLSAYAQAKGGRLPDEAELRHFLDLYDVGYEGGANVGFRNWHPVPSTMGVDEANGGRGSNGGVWEWTRTLFDGHEGMVATKIFPGYSADFFDSKHHVVLGASYATIPRLAERTTLRNFWQHNYPYAWVGGRVVYDAC